ncbi:MAG TPA: 3'-5' exonuclease, partial [Xanthobacteraceae bacterium]|nr:3'-5' exonuclease [Xanthobacteraceae bacterium]
ALRELVASFDRWSAQLGQLPHTALAEIILDESGYTDMWQKERTADAAGRLENLKELVRSMEGFENMQGFLEHISLVMDVEAGAPQDAVNVMTLHSAKGLEFDTVYLPGWEEGLLPHQRSMDEQGRAGLEEERRLAHVGMTRARLRARIFFASHRRIHGLWNTTLPSRFLDELPEGNVEVVEIAGGWGGRPVSRFDRVEPFAGQRDTPGWRRGRARRQEEGGNGPGFQEKRRGFRAPPMIEGELVAKSTGVVGAFAAGERVFHQKFGYGEVTAVDGNKLTVQFDKAGEKRVVDSFLARV